MNGQMMARLLGQGAMGGATGGGDNKLLPALLGSPLVGDIAGGAAIGGIGALLGGDDSEEQKKRRKLEEQQMRHQQMMDNLRMLMQYTSNVNSRIPGGGT